MFHKSRILTFELRRRRRGAVNTLVGTRFRHEPTKLVARRGIVLQEDRLHRQRSPTVLVKRRQRRHLLVTKGLGQSGRDGSDGVHTGKFVQEVFDIARGGFQDARHGRERFDGFGGRNRQVESYRSTGTNGRHAQIQGSRGVKEIGIVGR